MAVACFRPASGRVRRPWNDPPETSSLLEFIMRYSRIAVVFGLIGLSVCTYSPDGEGLYWSIPTTRLAEKDSARVFVVTEGADGTVTAYAKTISLAGMYAVGSSDASVTVIEFGDFECPFCARAHAQTKRLRAQWLREGKVRWVFADFPLHIHRRAVDAALLARCIGEHGGPPVFWQAHDVLYERQSYWSNAESFESAFDDLASDFGVDAGSVWACWRSGDERRQIRTSLDLGVELGIQGTPTFFVNGYPVRGAVPRDDFQALVDDLVFTSPETLLRLQGIQIRE